jgi:hypothetical protein
MEKMKKIVLISLAIIALLAIAGPVFAQDLIRISPHSSYYGAPIMLTSPATFSVYLQNGADAQDPHIFLVMTETCYKGLTGNVKVNWTEIDSLTITTWNKETVNSKKVPPDTANGIGYTVSSLKSHLVTTEPIYWAFEPFLNGPITKTPAEFTIVLPSTASRMLVYALGKSYPTYAFTAACTPLFNNRVPPTQPGLVVPELVPAMLSLASFSALGLYAIKRRKK